jgi:peptide/nickel transport system substrate-binding protein
MPQFPSAASLDLSRRRFLQVGALGFGSLGIGAILAACSGGSSSSGVSGSPAAAQSSSGGTPVKGGNLRATLQTVSGLDPVKLTNGSGGLGYGEYAAVYDTICRWNNQTHQFEWRTGEFTANADSSVWTLAIKPNIKFQDGNSYDAAAVMAHLDRMLGPDGVGGSKALIGAVVKSREIVDPLTVKFTLNTPWVGFPAPFTKEMGMVPSPAQVAAQGANFAINPGPAGAGPFQFVSYTPGQQLVVKRNETYYGDPAYLDTITFSQIGGGQAALILDALKGDTLDIMLTRDYQAIHDSKADSSLYFAGYTVVPGNGNVLFNSFNVPPKARLAAQYATNSDTINTRVYNSLETRPGSEIFDKDFPYFPNVPGTPYDLDMAKKLVAQAKSEGWSGDIRILGTTETSSTNLVQTVAAMWSAAGMNPITNIVQPAQQSQLVSAQKDFDAAVAFSYEMSQSPQETYNQLYKSFNATTPRFGYTSPDMVAALNKLAVSTSQTDLVAVFKMIAETWQRDVPSVVFGNSDAAWIANKKIQGFQLSTSEAGIFHKVWISQ